MNRRTFITSISSFPAAVGVDSPASAPNVGVNRYKMVNTLFKECASNPVDETLTDLRFDTLMTYFSRNFKVPETTVENLAKGQEIAKARTLEELTYFYENPSILGEEFHALIATKLLLRHYSVWVNPDNVITFGWFVDSFNKFVQSTNVILVND